MGSVSLTTLANPVSCETFRARQVPESKHVQVTFGEACNQKLKVVSLSRDDAAIQTDWQPIDEFVANTGSGLDTTKADQVCDCDVPLGSHTYALTFRVTYDGETSEHTYDMPIDVQDPATLGEQGTGTTHGVLDAGSGDSEIEEPWSEPEPEEIQGLDCIAACQTGGPGTEAAAEAAAHDDSGCSVVSPGNSATLSPVLFLFLGMVPLWFLKQG